MQQEEWRPVVGYAGLYEISSFGRVRSLKRGPAKPLAPQRTGSARNRHGRYLKVLLSDGAARKQITVHRLVLEAFIGPRPPGQQARHLNGIPDDNRLTNLAWGTPLENQADSVRHGTHQRGAEKPFAKLREADVLQIRSMYASGAATQRALAKRYGVTQAVISHVTTRKGWTHV
jgi:hypothetical protein